MFTFKYNRISIIFGQKNSWHFHLTIFSKKCQNFVYDLSFEILTHEVTLSLDPLKGFETRILFNFVKKLSILTQNIQLFVVRKGRRTRKRERFAPEIGAYHLTFLFLDFEFEEEKENLTSQLCSLSFNSNWALGPRWAEPTRARVTQGLCGRTWNGAFGLSVPSLAPLGISNNKTMVSNDHWMVHIFVD